MRFEYYDNQGDNIKIPIPESYADCVTLIQSDRFRITGHLESKFLLIIKSLLFYRNPVLFWFRLTCYRGHLFHLCNFFYKRVCTRTVFELPPFTKVGYGLYVAHGVCMIINDRTIIGNNVNLSQFLNIGSNKSTPPLLGDNIYVGPHVSLVEDIVIGSNSTIGAGAVVCKDVPRNSTVVGVPAKVVNFSNPGRFITNKYVL